MSRVSLKVEKKDNPINFSLDVYQKIGLLITS